jgi:antitoxin (DNA-binding transcriptional repressor) of toxin-antitoxin stability system
VKENLFMPTTLIDVQDLPSRFAEIVKLADAGTEVIVTEGNVPRAKLLPLSPGHTRIPGLHAGAYTIADDFDAPLPDEFWTGES